MDIRLPQLEAELATNQGLDNMLLSAERHSSQMDMLQHQQQQLEEEAAATAAVAAEQAQEAEVQLQRHRQAQAFLEQGEELEVFNHQLLEELEGPQRHYHSHMPTLNLASEYNMRALSPLITSHQHYHQEQLRRPAAMVDNIFSHMQPPAAVTMPANTMDHQFNILPLGTNTPPLLSSNMQQLQPQPPITNTNTATMVNMGNIHMLHSHPHTQQAGPQQQERLVLPSMRSMLLNNTSIQSPVDHINSIMPQLLPPITTTTQQLLPQQPQPQQHTTNTIPSFQQLRQESELAPLEPTMIYRTTTGNETARSGEDDEAIIVNSSGSSESSDYIQLSTINTYGRLQSQRMITTDGQILQFMSSPLMDQPFYALPPRTTMFGSNPRSPQEGDLPPTHTLLGTGVHVEEQLYLQESSQPMFGCAVAPYSPKEELSNSDTISESGMNTTTTSSTAANYSGTSASITVSNDIQNAAKRRGPTKCQPAPKRQLAPRRQPAPKRQLASRRQPVARRQPTPKRQPALKRQPAPKRPKPNVSTTPRSIKLPNGRIQCVECNKDFSKNCYLSQHNKCIHAGEYKYRCEKCGKRFLSEEKQIKHTAKHYDTNKPCKCAKCPKQFHHNTDLRRHIEAIHTGLKPHICILCGKGFCRKDHLRKHIETHANPRQAARKLFATLYQERLFDVEALETPYRPDENDTSTETPTDTPADTSTDTPTDMSTDTPTDAPIDTPTETPTETKDEEQDQQNDTNPKNVDMKQCPVPNAAVGKPKTKRRRMSKSVQVRRVRANNNIRAVAVDVPPPLSTAPLSTAPLSTTPLRHLTSTVVSGALDQNSYTLNSTVESYIGEGSLVTDESNLEDQNSYIIKEEPYVDGMPYGDGVPEKQLSSFF